MTDDTVHALQLYSLRGAGDMPAQLALARKAGFRAVEPYGAQVADGAALARALAAHGLKAPSAHVSAGVLLADPARTFAAATAAGVGLVVLPAPPEAVRFGRLAAWRAFAADLAALAAEARAAGLTLGYHNHHWECLECEDGRTGLEILLDETAGSGLVWEADLAWVLRARQDPVPLLARATGRVPAVHVKDLAPPGAAVTEDGWTVPGQGTADWPALLAAARAAGARLLVAEHDNPADPGAYARDARASLARLAPAVEVPA
jgi:sugar phosphate isomerase/epimerase